MEKKSSKLNFYVSSLLFLALIVSVAMPAQMVQAATITTVVTPTSSDWLFLNDNGTIGDWTTGFENGPGTPPLGVGSAFIDLNSASAGIVFGTQKYQGTLLSAIQVLSYSTYTNLSPAALAFQINYDPDVTTVEAGTWYGRLIYEPYQNGTVLNGAWQTWDMINNGSGMWWASPNANSLVDTTCPQAAPCTLAALIAAYPNIGIRNDASSFVQVKAGSNWNGFSGNVDNLNIGIGGNIDVYNFEPLSDVYVDDSWSAAISGTDPDGTGPATNYNTDSFDTIQEGVNAVSIGGTVHVAAGTYNENIVINTNNISLIGALAMNANDAPTPTIHTIIDSGAPAVTTSPGIAINSGITGVTIKNLRIQNFSSNSGIYGALGNNGLTIDSVHVYSNNTTNAVNGGGIYMNGPVSNVLINNVDSQLNRARGIVIWNGFKQNITITNNYVKSNNCCGIELQDGTASGVTITGNTVISNSDSGIAAVGLTSGAGPNVISNNTVTNNGRFGIEIKMPNGTGAASGDGSIVVENNIVSLPTPGADLRDFAGIAVMRRAYQVGYGYADIPTGVIVRNNTVSDYIQTSTSDGFGIVVEGTKMKVEGNTLTNNDVGVQVQSGHTPYTANAVGDGDQSNLADTYFGRGNSPVACAYISASNIYSGNGVSSRNVGTVGSPAVQNVDTGTYFCSIQTAIDDSFTLAGHTISVPAGIYIEDLTINKSLTLLGPNSAINPNTGTRVAEAVIQPATQGTDPFGTCTDIIYVSTSNVTIKGLTIDGNNPTLTSGVLVNGVDVDACEGIAGFEGVGNIIVENNIIENTTYTGVNFDNDNTPGATAGNYIRNNLLNNIGNSTINYGIGVLVYDNFYADITNNVFTNVRVGIQTGNFHLANPGTTGSISNNTINAWRVGIFNNLWYSNASTITISNNTINAVSNSGSTKWNGILLSSIQGTVNATISNNIITMGTITQNPAAGYSVWNTPTTAPLTISGGSVTGGQYGVWVNNFEGYASDAGNTSITVDGVSISNASIAGINVWDSPSNTNSATVTATLKNNVITTSALGVQISGSEATSNGTCNQISSNTAGLNNTTGTLLTFEKNWWGAVSGPSGIGLGSGDTVSTNVDFTPWNTDTTCTTFVPPFPLVVTANNQTIIVGQPDPIFTFSYSGFVNGDTSAVIDVAPTCSVTGLHSQPGVYPIICSAGSDTNYTFSYINGSLTVNAANNPPTDISISNASINENQPVGNLVGTFSTSDPDVGDTFAYIFCGGTDDASFQITGNSLKSAAMFDFETKKSYSICVRSTDSGTLSTIKTLAISINNVIDTATFADVPMTGFAWYQIETIYAAGITSGCTASPLNYCPESSVTRAQMAVFLLKSIHTSSYVPPTVGASTGFNDVPVDYWAAAWIKQLAVEGITSGCSSGNYCPESEVTRAQMAIFLLKAKHGSSYTPPPVGVSTGFSDVAVGDFAAAWIKQLAAEAITSGCGSGNYCPNAPVKRSEMAIFLVRTFNLP